MAVHATGIRRFGWVIQGNAGLISGPWDEAVHESPAFVVMPSLGSLVPGWLVAVPRRPIINLSCLATEEVADLRALISDITRRYQREGTDWYIFEHGPIRRGSEVGCGVDQAHLHLVPLPFDLLSAVRSEAGGDVQWGAIRSGDMVSNLPTGEYIAVSHAKSHQFLIGAVIRPSSQWVRRVIARHVESPNRWDYRQHPEMDNIRLTITEAKTMLTR